MGEVQRVVDEISQAVVAAGADREEVERRLTDGYAHALELETERSRLRKHLARAVQGEAREAPGDVAVLAERLERTTCDLLRLRDALAELRRRVALARKPG